MVSKRISTYAVCRLSIAFVWLYQGLVPKLLGPHPDELAISMAVGFSRAQAAWVSIAGGVGEVLFGLAVLVCWRQRWPLAVTAAAMLGLLAFTAVVLPGLLLGAFNPVTTNLSVLALAVVALAEHEGPADARGAGS